MYSSGSQPTRNPRQSDSAAQRFRTDSFAQRLREGQPETESFRYADVSVYVDRDGSRYRIERLPAQCETTTEQQLPLSSSSDLVSRGKESRVAYTDRYIEGPNAKTVPAQGQLPQRRLRSDQPPLQLETFRKSSAHSREHGDTLSRSFRDAAPRDGSRHQARESGGDYSMDGSNSYLENADYSTWKDSESEGPNLQLSPAYNETYPSFPRDHRLGRSDLSSASPLSIIGNSQSQVNIPHSVLNGIDLRTPIVLPRSPPSTTSGESLPIETETPGERMLLET